MAAPAEDAPTVVRIEQGTEAVELVHDQLRAFVDAANRLLVTGLSDRALVVLLHDLTGIGKRDLQRVLDALPELEVFVK